MKIESIVLFTDNLKKQVDFFTVKLGFVIQEENSLFNDAPCIVLKGENAQPSLVIAKGAPENTFNNLIVLNTDDCLREYHKLHEAGINFCSEPQYIPLGLGAEFLDPAGNRFLLLETRKYAESWSI